MRRVRFGLLCRSLYRDQYASQIVPSLPADPMLGEPRLIPKRSAGPRATKIGVVSLKALDHHRPNREESRGEFLFATPQARHRAPAANFRALATGEGIGGNQRRQMLAAASSHAAVDAALPRPLGPRNYVQASGAGLWRSLRGHRTEAGAGRRRFAKPRLGYTRAADLLEAGHAARAGVARGQQCAPNLKPSSKTKSPKGGSAIKSFAAMPL